MAISPCLSGTDELGRELARHGSAAFPIACYHDDLGRECVPWHWHEEWEAVVISHGRCTVAAGNEKYIIGPGEGFFVNSGILHGCWDLEDSGCRFHSLVFHPRLVGGGPESLFHRDYVRPVLESVGLESLHLRPEVTWQRAALEAIEEAWQACAREGRGYEFRVRAALSDLTLELAEHLAAPGLPDSRARRDSARMKRMMQYIHDHFPEELTVADIAGQAAVSESECLRCFRSTIGTTPIRYLRQYRIQRAAAMLATGAESVASVAEACGFSDVSYFTKTFRQLRGCPPAAYRRSEQPKCEGAGMSDLL